MSKKRIVMMSKIKLLIILTHLFCLNYAMERQDLTSLSTSVDPTLQVALQRIFLDAPKQIKQRRFSGKNINWHEAGSLFSYRRNGVFRWCDSAPLKSFKYELFVTNDSWYEWDPSGKYLAVWNGETEVVVFADLLNPSLDEVKEKSCSSHSKCPMTWSPDGKYLATCHRDGKTVELWKIDFTSQMMHSEKISCPSYINSIYWSAKGDQLFVEDTDERGLLIDVKSKAIKQLGYIPDSSPVAFSNEGLLAFINQENENFQLKIMKNYGSELISSTDHKKMPTIMKWSSVDSLLGFLQEGKLNLLTIDSQKTFIEKIIINPYEVICNFAWIPSQSNLAYITQASEVGLYFPKTNNRIHIPDLKIHELSFPPNGEFLLLISDEYAYKVPLYTQLLAQASTLADEQKNLLFRIAHRTEPIALCQHSTDFQYASAFAQQWPKEIYALLKNRVVTKCEHCENKKASVIN